MGVEEAGRARGGGGKKLALASIGFADVRVGAAGGASYREDLLEVGLPLPGPKDDGGLAVRLPDVAGAVKVRRFLPPSFCDLHVAGATQGDESLLRFLPVPFLI